MDRLHCAFCSGLYVSVSPTDARFPKGLVCSSLVPATCTGSLSNVLDHSEMPLGAKVFQQVRLTDGGPGRGGGAHADFLMPPGQRVVLCQACAWSSPNGVGKEAGGLAAPETAQPFVYLSESVSGKVPVN